MSSLFHVDPSFTGYGKAGVRLLKIKRNGKYHSIKQIEVSTELKLNNYSDYLYGDNASVVPTDTQKNTVYALAKEHQVRSLSSKSCFAIVNFKMIALLEEFSGVVFGGVITIPVKLCSSMYNVTQKYPHYLLDILSVI